MLEKWRETIDKGDCFGALLTDLSKAFDYILHDLLVAKLHAYGVEMKSLRLLLQSVKDFKAKIRSWVPENYPCRLCKIYIQHTGFI